ncbi:MAG: metallophosphoesterase family protein [Deltaproteobacteria bacterium]|jgi:Icc-related predicted phosphoesterase|nr:metallophosphoesterase family protein [Deltaproteobacteria bacterium]
MKLLVFSDLHSDFRIASQLVELSHGVDVVVGAGDFCNVRRGLDEIIRALSAINKLTILVPGNSESDLELIDACRTWDNAHVLHGGQAIIDGVSFYGIGSGIPVTPFGSWSYDFTEKEAHDLLNDCPQGGVLVSHSPPKGILDISSDGSSLGSQAVRDTLEQKKPDLVVCGHIHGSAGQTRQFNETTVINAGPHGIIWNL